MTKLKNHRQKGNNLSERAVIGHNCHIDDNVAIGYPYAESCGPARLGDGARVRWGSVIYGDTQAGTGFTTGHHALVREHTTIGDDVLVGSGTVIDGQSKIGSNVSLQSRVYVPVGTTIGDDVFIGPGAILTNDPYPVRLQVELKGPTVGDHASIGANATVLPGVVIGEGAFIAAGAVVTSDVPPGTLAIGVPASHRALPNDLTGPNLLS